SRLLFHCAGGPIHGCPRLHAAARHLGGCRVSGKTQAVIPVTLQLRSLYSAQLDRPTLKVVGRLSCAAPRARASVQRAAAPAFGPTPNSPRTVSQGAKLCF